MSRILCIIDGMTDPQFHAEDYPALSAMHRLMTLDTCQGAPPESFGCILRLLGFREIPPRLRGYAEALGAGIPVAADDLVLRGSWFARDEDGCCSVPVSAPAQLEIPDCRYYPLGQYKSLLVFPGLAAEIRHLRTHAPYDCVGRSAELLCPEGSPVLRRVFETCLHPDRCLLLWGESAYAQLQPYPRRAAVICGTTVVKGIAQLLQMDLLRLPGATGDTDTDLVGKAQAALLAAQHYGTVVLHVNGADEAAHRRDPAEKRRFLQRVDCELLPPLLRSEHEVLVMADHGSDPISGSHLGDAQPVYASQLRLSQEERKRVWAIAQLQRRAAELGHLPRKADFDEQTRCRIKYALGPWPRALEAAGLKERKSKEDRKGRN